MSRGFLLFVVFGVAMLALCLAAPAPKIRYARAANGTASTNASAPSNVTSNGNSSNSGREAEGFLESFIDLSKFRDADEAQVADDAVEERGDALDRDSVATFRDTISVSHISRELRHGENF